MQIATPLEKRKKCIVFMFYLNKSIFKNSKYFTIVSTMRPQLYKNETAKSLPDGVVAHSQKNSLTSI
jgi:hypothetical protein